MSKRFDAAKSLYGKGHLDATRTRECVAMPGKREQSVYTPLYILDRVRIVWPEGIQLDPCSSNEPAAEGYWYKEGSKKKWQPGVPEPNSLVRAAQVYTVEDDGLAQPWVDRTFWNPPYATLKDWIAKDRDEDVESIGLVPARTHRKWLDLRAFDRVCFCDPVKFYGHRAAFPQPVLLLGLHVDKDAFDEAFSDIGRCGTVL